MIGGGSFIDAFSCFERFIGSKLCVSASLSFAGPLLLLQHVQPVAHQAQELVAPDLQVVGLHDRLVNLLDQQFAGGPPS